MATDVDDPTEDARFGRVGKQTIKDTGPRTRKRMETVDDEFLDRAVDCMRTTVQAGKPFFVWHALSRMHIYTHLREGRLLQELDNLGVASDTIVVFTTDDGAMAGWWPDGGTTPFRGEKATTWEGGVRAPMLVRWPARIPAGKISNGIQDNTAVFVTLAAAAGSLWETGDATGHDAMEDGRHRLLNAAIEMSCWFLPGQLGAMARATQEFDVRDRFEGRTFTAGVNLLF